MGGGSPGALKVANPVVLPAIALLSGLSGIPGWPATQGTPAKLDQDPDVSTRLAAQPTVQGPLWLVARGMCSTWPVA